MMLTGKSRSIETALTTTQRENSMHIFNTTELAHARAVREYLATGDNLLLHEALTALGFDRIEIQQHIDRPGWRMPQGFA